MGTHELLNSVFLPLVCFHSGMIIHILSYKLQGSYREAAVTKVKSDCLELKVCAIICNPCNHVGQSVSSVAQSYLTLCHPMNRSTPGLPVHLQFLEFTQTDVHRVSDAIQPSHPLSSPSPPAPNPSQHQSLISF